MAEADNLPSPSTQFRETSDPILLSQRPQSLSTLAVTFSSGSVSGSKMPASSLEFSMPGPPFSTSVSQQSYKAAGVRALDKQDSKKIKELEVKCKEFELFLKKGPYSDIEAGAYSDFKVRCFEKIFHLHRVVVLPQSAYFTTMLNGPARALYDTKEPHINLKMVDPRIFSMFVQLMYLRGLDPEKIAPSPPCSLEYAKLLEVAESFGDKATQKLATEIAKPRMAEMCRGFRADNHITLSNWNAFTEVVKLVYRRRILSEFCRDLLKHVGQHAALNWRYLKARDRDVKEFLNKMPDFAVELLSNVAMFSKEERAA